VSYIKYLIQTAYCVIKIDEKSSLMDGYSYDLRISDVTRHGTGDL